MSLEQRKPQQLEEIRKAFPEHFFLIPGVGSQGGNLKEVSEAALNDEGGILVNVSRAIIYAGEKLKILQKKEDGLQKDMQMK